MATRADVTKASADSKVDRGERWNTDENPAVDGDQFMFVAAVNFALRAFRKLRAKLRR